MESRAVYSQDGTSELFNKPLLGLLLADLLEVAELSGSVLSSHHSLARSGEDNVEIHAVNTSRGIILDSEIDVFVNTEAEVAYLIIKLLQEEEQETYLHRRNFSF
jgi:hypothetical protein